MREVKKILLLCDNEGCNKSVGYWLLFKEYAPYYTEQVKRNGTFYCYRCYTFKQKWKEDQKKQASANPIPISYPDLDD